VTQRRPRRGMNVLDRAAFPAPFHQATHHSEPVYTAINTSRKIPLVWQVTSARPAEWLRHHHRNLLSTKEPHLTLKTTCSEKLAIW
jgi:hypothetical protein